MHKAPSAEFNQGLEILTASYMTAQIATNLGDPYTIVTRNHTVVVISDYIGATPVTIGDKLYRNGSEIIVVKLEGGGVNTVVFEADVDEVNILTN